MATTLDNRHTLALPYWARPGFSLFAKKADDDDEGSAGKDDDEDEEPDEDEEEGDDPDKDKSPEELKAELARVRAALAKSNTNGAKGRARRKELERQLAEREDASGKAKSKGKKADDDDEDVDARVSAAEKAAEKRATEKANARIINSEAKAALIAKGASPDRVKKLLGLLDRDDLEVDDEGEVDGLDDAVDELVTDFPELFTRKSAKRFAGKSGRDGNDDGKRPMSATERQVAALKKRAS